MLVRYLLPLFSVLAFLPLDAAAITARASGGNPEGGPVLCVAVDPGDAQVLYAGTWAGLYRSTNTGGTWSLLDLPFPDPVFSLIWDAQQSTLFAGGAGRVFVGDKSGSVWSAVELPTDAAPLVTAMLAPPEMPSVVFAGTAGRGVFRSGDSGVSWAELRMSDTDAQRTGALEVRDLAYVPLTKRVYVATPDGLFRADTSLLSRIDYVATTALVFRTQDSRLYASAPNTVRSTSASGWRTEAFSGTNPHSILDLCVDPHDPSVIWAGDGSGIYQGRFEIDPATKEQTIQWSKPADVQTAVGSVACSNEKVGLMFAGGVSGFWLTQDAGANWRTSNVGIRASRFVDVIPGPNGSGTLFGLAQDSLAFWSWNARVFRSTTAGGSWDLSLEARANNTRPNLVIDVRPTGTATVYLEGRFASTDLGENWTTDIPFNRPGTAFSFYIDPVNTDNQAVGVSWEAYPHFPPLFYTRIRVTSNAWQSRRELWNEGASLLRTDPHSPDSLYFLTGYKGIRRWDVNAASPSLLVPLTTAEDFDPDRSIPGRLYFVSERRLFIYSGDSGQSQLSSLPARLAALTVRSAPTRPGVVAAGTSDGLYLSPDSGMSWEKVNVRDVSVGQVFGIFFDLTDPSILYLGTSRGPFRLELLKASERRSRESRMR